MPSRTLTALTAAGLAALAVACVHGGSALAAPAKATPPKAAPAPALPTASTRLPGADGGWDYASFDAGRGRVYVARTNGVMVIDVATGKVTDHFADGQRTHGVVVIPGSDALLVTNGADATAHLISAADGSLIAAVPTGKGPDAAVYDPATKLVWVMDHAAGDITLVDPKTHQAAGTVTVGGTLEFAAVDGKGRLYVNAEDKNDIAVIDTRSRKLLKRYPLKGCDGPSGLVLTDKGLLIATCDGVAAVLDAATGRQLPSITIGVGPDAAIYDAPRQRVYIPTGRDGQLWTIDVSGRVPRLLGASPSVKGARTGTVDTATGVVYLPAAEYQPAVQGQRPATVPGSFFVLVMKPG